MAKIKPEILNEIAQQIDCGNKAYYNPKSEELICIPNFNDHYEEEEFKEFLGEEIEKVEDPEFQCITPLESWESFEIMENFAYQLNEGLFKNRLIEALSKRKPFRHFKHLVDHSDFRQDWFDFKQKELEKHVERQLI
ncbi:UPF0158 family protein [Luteibaculum oceani]|uniref:UPF0158 family protein n=1 Tax=Luteibaculum oceani TaxID=1294296 RepID=UPI001CB9AC75|nr:UPF0158 family protein [Luteibaculum oceani]